MTRTRFEHDAGHGNRLSVMDEGSGAVMFLIADGRDAAAIVLERPVVDALLAWLDTTKVSSEESGP